MKLTFQIKSYENVFPNDLLKMMSNCYGDAKKYFLPRTRIKIGQAFHLS